MAFANKAVTVIWGMVWGFFIFGESVSALNILGAAMVIVGVVLYARADGKEAVSYTHLDVYKRQISRTMPTRPMEVRVMNIGIVEKPTNAKPARSCLLYTSRAFASP